MVRSLLITLVALVLCATYASAQSTWDAYNNSRFGFSVEYPNALLTMQPPPENDDGRTFTSSDNTVEMRVWGQYNAENEKINDRYDTAVKGLGSQPTYTSLGKTGFVISGIKDGKIHYEKTMYRRDKKVGTWFTLVIDYPTSQKAKFDPIVTRIARSFKFSGGS